MKVLTIILLGIIFSLTACRQPAPPLPTSVSVAELPTPLPPTATTLPPTTDLTLLEPPPPPTLVPVTSPPTATTAPLAPLVNIMSPDEGADFILGSDVIVRGLMQRQNGQSIWLALVSWNGRLLTEVRAAVTEQSWEAPISIPPFVSGAAYLQATIRDEAGQILVENRLSVNLIVDTNSTERYLALYRPLPKETAVGGFNLFFDGTIYRPVNSVITISVWVDDCQTRVSRQSFVLGRSTHPIYWQGFTVIPQGVIGPGCAIAQTGDPDSDDWREAVMPINILPTDDPAAKGIRIGSPLPDSHIAAGRELYLYGTALNISEGPVSVTVLMENGRIISQSTSPTDYWGYWEFRVTIPPDVSGPAKVTVSTGAADSENYIEAVILIIVDPAPTVES